jgi:phosphatidylethanolamine/phosphatidyl-N-methylethanolamine N-methyltransferase
MFRDPALFLRQFVRSPRTVGAVLPSSSALAHAMLDPIDFTSARTVVEFGPGTGAFTREIARRLAPGCRYLGIELNGRFAAELARSFPDLRVVHGSVAELARILGEYGVPSVEVIVCGLPWATLPVSLQQSVFAAMDKALAPGGVFVTFGYLQALLLPRAWAFRRRLRHKFREFAHTRVVWRNVPPAFAYVCRK